MSQLTGQTSTASMEQVLEGLLGLMGGVATLAQQQKQPESDQRVHTKVIGTYQDKVAHFQHSSSSTAADSNDQSDTSAAIHPNQQQAAAAESSAAVSPGSCIQRSATINTTAPSDTELHLLPGIAEILRESLAIPSVTSPVPNQRTSNTVYLPHKLHQQQQQEQQLIASCLSPVAATAAVPPLVEQSDNASDGSPTAKWIHPHAALQPAAAAAATPSPEPCWHNVQQQQRGDGHSTGQLDQVPYQQLAAAAVAAAATTDASPSLGTPPAAHCCCQSGACGHSRGSSDPVKKSSYRGLTWDRKDRRWRVRIHYLGKQHHIGRYPDEVEAAQQYDVAAYHLFGNTAVTNFGVAAAAASNIPVPASIKYLTHVTADDVDAAAAAALTSDLAGGDTAAAAAAAAECKITTAAVKGDMAAAVCTGTAAAAAAAVPFHIHPQMTAQRPLQTQLQMLGNSSIDDPIKLSGSTKGVQQQQQQQGKPRQYLQKFTPKESSKLTVRHLYFQRKGVSSTSASLQQQQQLMLRRPADRANTTAVPAHKAAGIAQQQQQRRQDCGSFDAVKQHTSSCGVMKAEGAGPAEATASPTAAAAAAVPKQHDVCQQQQQQAAVGMLGGLLKYLESSGAVGNSSNSAAAAVKQEHIPYVLQAAVDWQQQQQQQQQLSGKAGDVGGVNLMRQMLKPCTFSSTSAAITTPAAAAEQSVQLATAGTLKPAAAAAVDEADMHCDASLEGHTYEQQLLRQLLQLHQQQLMLTNSNSTASGFTTVRQLLEKKLELLQLLQQHVQGELLTDEQQQQSQSGPQQTELLESTLDHKGSSDSAFAVAVMKPTVSAGQQQQQQQVTPAAAAPAAARVPCAAAAAGSSAILNLPDSVLAALCSLVGSTNNNSVRKLAGSKSSAADLAATTDTLTAASHAPTVPPARQAAAAAPGTSSSGSLRDKPVTPGALLSALLKQNSNMSDILLQKTPTRNDNSTISSSRGATFSRPMHNVAAGPTANIVHSTTATPAALIAAIAAANAPATATGLPKVGDKRRSSDGDDGGGDDVDVLDFPVGHSMTAAAAAPPPKWKSAAAAAAAGHNALAFASTSATKPSSILPPAKRHHSMSSSAAFLAQLLAAGNPAASAPTVTAAGPGAAAVRRRSNSSSGGGGVDLPSGVFTLAEVAAVLGLQRRGLPMKEEQ